MKKVYRKIKRAFQCYSTLLRFLTSLFCITVTTFSAAAALELNKRTFIRGNGLQWQVYPDLYKLLRRMQAKIGIFF